MMKLVGSIFGTFLGAWIGYHAEQGGTVCAIIGGVIGCIIGGNLAKG